MKGIIKSLKRDKVMKKIIENTEISELKPKKDYFNTLIQSIMYQQLNGKAAESIYNKFLLLFKEKPTPKLLSKVSQEDLASAGVSRQKRSYLYSLAGKFLDKTIKPGQFNDQTDEEIIDELTQVKGIGKWSAQMFLMFTLNRMDVFAPDDLGLRKAIMINYKMSEMPKPKQAEEFAKKWAPYRTIASLYLWKSLLN